MGRKPKNQLSDEPEPSLYAKFLPAGKKLVQVCDNPKTWVEMPADATEEEIQAKIAKYKEQNPSLSDRIAKGEFKITDEEMRKPHKPYRGYTGPIYSLPRLNSSQLKW